MATPASASPAATSVSVQPTSTTGRTVTPAEVGWQFVPQYYTFVNKQPHKLHCFYNRNSTFTHGTEGEDVKHLSGQAQIHEKIVSLGFQDCKVYINSVDAQASVGGGIIIQVIGEMSNRGEAWRKFAQTFFLAEQPNGYYVLNDIFRFLKEETLADSASQEEELIEGEPEGAAPVEAHLLEPVEPATINGYHPELEKPEFVVPDEQPIGAPEEQPAEVEDVAAPQPDHPGISTVVEPSAPAPSHVEEPAPAETHEETPEEEDEPEPAPAAPEEVASKVQDVKPPMPDQPPTSTVTAPAPAPGPIPSSAPTPAPAVAAASPAAPAPAPTGPKTWANLAAKDSNRWGANVASEARGVSAAPPPAKVAAPVTIPASAAGPAGISGSATPGSQTSRDRGMTGDRGMHPNAVAAMSVTTGQCFVKGVTENVSTTALRETLTTRFGPIKELEIVRSKACAFLEFVQPDGARKAILASLPLSQGGEGGIRIPGAPDGGEGGRINVEMRKERGDRPTSNPRGGARGGVPGGAGGPGEGRGSFRGRGGGERGAPPPAGGAGRGDRGRGRGQAQQQK